MKSLLLCLFLLPLLSAVAVCSLQGPTQSTGIQAGLVVESATPYALQVANQLTNQQEISFSLYPDLDSLVEAVSHGTIVAGYVLDEQFDVKVSTLDTARLVQLVKLEDDIYHKYVNEVVYTAVYTQIVPYITQDFLSQRGIDIGLSDITAQTTSYLAGDRLFTMDFRSVQAIDALQNVPSPLPLVRGILAVGLLTLVLLAAAASAESQRGWALFSPYLRKIQLDFYALSPIYLLGLLSAGASLGIVSVLSPLPLSLLSELGRVALYLLILMVLGLALPHVIGRDAIVLLIPFLLLFVVATHPIFFDITVLFPNWEGWLQWLPSYWYLS